MVKKPRILTLPSVSASRIQGRPNGEIVAGRAASVKRRLHRPAKATPAPQCREGRFGGPRLRSADAPRGRPTPGRTSRGHAEVGSDVFLRRAEINPAGRRRRASLTRLAEDIVSQLRPSVKERLVLQLIKQPAHPETERLEHPQGDVRLLAEHAEKGIAVDQDQAALLDRLGEGRIRALANIAASAKDNGGRTICRIRCRPSGPIL